MRMLLVALVLSACGSRAPSAADRKVAAAGAVRELQAAHFQEALDAAGKVIAQDRGNPEARVVAAIARWRLMMGQLDLDVRTAFGGVMAGAINHKYFRQALESADRELARIEEDLAAAAGARDLALEMCLACWEVDWNRNQRIDESDRRFLEIEIDAAGQDLPEGDPRRRPTFRFDVGDVHWGLAMVSFQRAAIDLVLAYRWTEIDKMLGGGQPVLRIILEDPARVKRARDRILAGLDHSDRSREAYLAETDDDREWLPSPRQKSHPMPLPVDAELYATWAAVTGDLRRLLRGEEGIDVASAFQLGDHQWPDPPPGFIDVGRLFEHPGDIVLDTRSLENAEQDPAGALRSVFGAAYVTTMKATPLLGRFVRMKAEVERGEESFERKLRYLFWVN